ncbi:hypothetical protein V5O48_017947 [Marasmius crinis-equi]|uniref:Uncharacterized protein n=1 Tax=Marasmius crinis-equi TaxID=585013 RepID=A0ABR3EMK7_9AGAR
MRWREELELLEEEMRRIPISFEHDAKRWEARRVADDGSPLAEGINSYSFRQAGLLRALSSKFLALWALPDPVRKQRKTALPVIPEEPESEESDDE